MSDQRILTVTELTRQIKLILESSLPDLWIEGEISDFTWHRSGHMYFTLKDRDAQLRCVMWKSHNQHLFFTPREGTKIQARGKITLYERGGQYQLTVYQMHPVGSGELRMAFERLANKLREEGLFRQEFKKSLPSYPTYIGVVTSATGAAIQDIVRVISERFPPAKIILRSAAVQGKGAAEQIARAIEELNADGRAQVIIVGRGGGSPEDLWAFNEEKVARSIFASHIPVVSAVGHEVDLTISDLVADLRAPTPSAAGELIVPHKREIFALLNTLQDRMIKAMQAEITARRGLVAGFSKSHGMQRCADLIVQRWQLADQLAQRLRKGWDNLRERWEDALKARAQQLQTMDPKSVMERGYSVCRRLVDLKVISDASDLCLKDAIEVTFAHGKIEGSVSHIEAHVLRDMKNGRRDG